MVVSRRLVTFAPAVPFQPGKEHVDELTSDQDRCRRSPSPPRSPSAGRPGRSPAAATTSSNATGPGADKARAAALAHLGGGHANAVERDNEDGATWEVEVTKSDGNTVDVRLDANYKVVVVEGDSESNDSAENESN